MSTPNELERLARAVIDAETETAFHYAREAFAEAAPQILSALSERAELLDTVAKMRGEIIFATTTLYPEALFRLADTLDQAGVVKETGEVLRMMGHNEQVMADRLRAALTTGEDK